jgi:hypothetical protein
MWTYWFAYRGRLLCRAFLFDALKAIALFEMIGENWKNSSSKREFFCTAFSLGRRRGDLGLKERNKTVKAVYGYLKQ